MVQQILDSVRLEVGENWLIERIGRTSRENTRPKSYITRNLYVESVDIQVESCRLQYLCCAVVQLPSIKSCANYHCSRYEWVAESPRVWYLVSTRSLDTVFSFVTSITSLLLSVSALILATLFPRVADLNALEVEDGWDSEYCAEDVVLFVHINPLRKDRMNGQKQVRQALDILANCTNCTVMKYGDALHVKSGP